MIGKVVTVCAVLSVISPGALVPGQIINNWTGASQSNPDLWYEDDNWSLGEWPKSNHFARDPASSVVIQYQQGMLDVTVDRFEGVATSAGRTLRLQADAFLGVNQDAFKSGSGSYTIQLEQAADFLVSTETYGFDWLLNGANAVAFASQRFGYGRVDVVGGLGFPPGVSVSQPGGIIDPAYDAATGQNPISASPWTLTGASNFRSDSEIVRNVGLWTFLPTQGGVDQVTFNTNNFSLYPTAGSFHIRSTRVNVNFAGTTNPPRMTLPGSSELRYVTFGQNEIFMSIAEDTSLEFTGAASLLRPRQLSGGSDYPTVATSDPLTNFSLQIHIDHGKLDIQTNITRDGKRFDGSYADIFSRPDLTLEVAAIDTCNLQFMDFLLPDPAAPSGPLTCFPTNNRCNKSWRLLHLDVTTTFTLINDRDNQVSDYGPVPTGDPPEAVYFCATETPDDGAFVSNGLRLYTRSKNQPDFPAILIVLSRYGDFEADFDVDLVDFARLQNCFTGQNTTQAPNAHATWYPLADWGTDANDAEADADVDLYDFVVFQQRWHSSGTGYQVCATPPTANESMLNGDPDIIVCGGPLHVRPDDAPELDCPPCSAYNYVPTCESGFAGGGGESMAMAGGGMELLGGEDEPEALAFFDGEPVEFVPEYGLSAEVLAESLLASLPPGELASFAAQLASDAEASGDTVAAAVAQLLN